MDAVSQYVKQLDCHDRTFKLIRLFNKQLTDVKLAELVDCLLANPNVVTQVLLGSNKLTDETGVKLVQYAAASSTIQTLDLHYNQLSTETYLAMATALCINTSLQCLYLFGNQEVDKTHIDVTFINALRFNPHRSIGSIWWLHSFKNDFKRLQNIAKKSSPPSMLEFLLYVHLNTEEIKTKIH